MTSYSLIETAWTLTIVAVLVAVMVALTGCATNPCVAPVVSLDEPVLPTIPATELSCLSPTTWDALWQRDVILQSRLRECRAAVEELTDGD